MFGNKKLEDINEDNCQAYIDFLSYDCDLRISTVRKHYATLSAFLTWCVKQNLIASNPMKNIEKPVDNEGEEKVETFSVEELKKILLCSEKEPLMWQAMIYLLADTGMRRGEACGLRWADIDFASGRIHIVNNAQYTEGKGVYDTNTKSKKERDVYANPQVIEILKKWKTLQKEVVEGQNLPTPKHIFTHLDGKRINPQAPTAYLRKFGEKYGIDDCHPHKFRHTMATIMIQNGSDIKTVSTKLGHRSIEITLSLYCHSNKDAQQAANEKFASLVWNG
jgi:integrase